eukprot:1195904-Prorocentrum_minimum.AAC.2
MLLLYAPLTRSSYTLLLRAPLTCSAAFDNDAGGGMYAEEVDPFEVFNMFFGGVPMGGGMRFQTHRGGGFGGFQQQQQAHRRQQRDQQRQQHARQPQGSGEFNWRNMVRSCNIGVRKETIPVAGRRAAGENGELDEAVRKGERERWALRAPSPLLAQEDPSALPGKKCRCQTATLLVEKRWRSVNKRQLCWWRNGGDRLTNGNSVGGETAEIG